MKIAVIGRGNIGGGLADLWERAGHEVVRRIGREGGDVSEADAVLVAVPGGAIAEALDNVQGIEGKTVIDATNLEIFFTKFREPPTPVVRRILLLGTRVNRGAGGPRPQGRDSAARAGRMRKEPRPHSAT
jgi:hypothetical protein